MKNSLFCLIIASTVLLAGCGHKGPLVMPPEAPQAPAEQPLPAPDVTPPAP